MNLSRLLCRLQETLVKIYKSWWNYPTDSIKINWAAQLKLGGADMPLALLQVPPFFSTPVSFRETPHPGANWYRGTVVWGCGSADREVLWALSQNIFLDPDFCWTMSMLGSFTCKTVILGEHSPDQSQTTGTSEKVSSKPHWKQWKFWAVSAQQQQNNNNYLVPHHIGLLTSCLVILNIRTGDCLSLSDFWFFQISDLAVVAKPRFILSHRQGHGHLHAIRWVSVGTEGWFHLSRTLFTTLVSVTVSFFVKISFSQTLERHIQIVTAMLCIPSTEELLGNINAHFWLTVKTMKNLEEILLTSDPPQHSRSFKLASLWTQEPVGTSNVGQDSLSHFLCIPSHLSSPLFPPTFRRFHSSVQCYTFEKKSYVLDVKAHHTGRISPWEGTPVQNSTACDTVEGWSGPAASLPSIAPFTPHNRKGRRK